MICGLPLLQIIPQLDSYFLTVTDKSNKVYRFSTLSEYNFRDRLVIRLAGWFFFTLINLIGKTLRFDVDGSDYADDPDMAEFSPIVCSWHDRIFGCTYYMRGRGLVVMSSISFDAEYTARFIQRFGFGVIKGSSTRGGTRALVEMIRLVKDGYPTAFTIDGPRGPRYRVKPGPALLAKKTGNPMIPFMVETKRFRTMKSWDKLQIPMPFSRAKAFFAEPIFVSPGAADEELEQKSSELQRALDDLVLRGKAWAQRK